MRPPQKTTNILIFFLVTSKMMHQLFVVLTVASFCGSTAFPSTALYLPISFKLATVLALAQDEEENNTNQEELSVAQEVSWVFFFLLYTFSQRPKILPTKVGCR